jgi:septum formation protein
MIRLCSSSPTRASILQSFGIDFEQVSCEFDEDAIKTQIPSTFVYEASKGKFECCKKRYGIDTPLLAADTVVTAQNKLLRKAKNVEEARAMLALQSANEVKIITSLFFQSNNVFISDLSSTTYCLAPFEKEDLERYLQSGEWMGKAGAIMVEGFCKKYIQSVRGLESTAMGLQVQKILPYV